MRSSNCVLICLLFVVACSPKTWDQRNLHAPSRPPSPTDAAVLKIHLHSGELVVLRDWQEADTALSGTGAWYDLDRRQVRSGRFTIPIDSIALLETSVRHTSRPAGPTIMAVFTTIWGVFTAACVADPKSCFGSCPTFYVASDTGEVLAAEGFSSSIARVLEARDLDALYAARVTGGRFTLRMRNEALETHAVRRLRLYATPRPPGGRVFATPDGRFFPAGTITRPTRCAAAEGDCLSALTAVDGIERVSTADSLDLATVETIELEFPDATGQLGLVLGARQSLLSTFLFYQTMAYLGTQAGAMLARVERMPPEAARRIMGMARLVGRIEVELWERGAWRTVGTYEEAGPLATQFTVLPFARTAADGPVRVRIHMTKGAWRLGYVALAQLGEPATPVRLDPESVTRDGFPDDGALATLLDSTRHLVTYPGDEYVVAFRLPNTEEDFELFLESEGYYYEWMRQEWLAEEDADMAALVLMQPADGLRVLARQYRGVAPRMERLFWSSRFRR